MENVTDTFSTRLRELRGIEKQEDVAKNIGISRGALSYYESGERKPDINVLHSISKYYQVSADYLIGLSDTKSFNLDEKATSDSLGLSDKSISNLKNINAIRKIMPESSLDTLPATCEVYMRTINYLIEDTNEIEINSLLAKIAIYLFGSFTHFYDDNTVSCEAIYQECEELGLWDSHIGIELPFDSELFSKSFLLALQEKLISSREYIQNHLLPKRITPVETLDDIIGSFDDDI